MSSVVVCKDLTLDGVTKAPVRPDEETPGSFQHDGRADIQVRHPNTEPVASWPNHSDIASTEHGSIEQLWSALALRPGRYGEAPLTGGRC